MSKINLGKVTKTIKTAQNKPAALPSAKRVMPLDGIRDRPHQSTRDIDDVHVQELVESISEFGLIQPLAVDSQGHLLAGGHRREALFDLKQQNPKAFEKHFPGGQIPVKVFSFDASKDEDRAIAIEVSENERRRDYTKSEVKALADRLVSAGYRNTKGKPRKGQKALIPALEVILGKSRSTVKRYLAEDEPVDKGPNEPLSKWAKRADQLEKWAKESEDPSIAKTLRNAAKKLRQQED